MSVPDKTSIPVEDLISISVPKALNSSQTHYPVLDATSPSLNDVAPNEDFNHKSFTVNYAKRLKELDGEHGSAGSCKDVNKWRIHNITLYNNDKMIVKEWYDTLSKVLNGEQMNNNDVCH